MVFPRAVDLVNKFVGIAGLNVTANIAYGDGPRRKFDIYAPAGAVDLPVIVFFYGGSWQFGNRSDYRFVAALLARRGFVVAVPDYRIYPDVQYPDFLEDCAAATAHIMHSVFDYGGNPQKIYLIGHSAGGYNAVMLALNAGLLRAAGASPDGLAGVVGLSGPYDFLPLRDPVIKQIFTADDLRLTQPITYARPGAPPLFLVHGGRDTIVLPRNTTALAARLRRQGGVVEAKIFPNLGHIGVLTTLLPYLAWRAPVWKAVFAFLAARQAETPPVLK